MNQPKCKYDYANKCDCSEDDKCGCTFPNNLSHDFDCDFLSDDAFSYNSKSEKLSQRSIHERLPHDIVFENEMPFQDQVSATSKETERV